ncbi:MAG: hypothetical protein GC168_18035 [Candidatus Hydrogenedens sp.]|nr:hypothetical protein [Candidatus Hydrogenedens sp.]
MKRAQQKYVRAWGSRLAWAALLLSALEAGAALLQPGVPPVPWTLPAAGDAPHVVFFLPEFTREDVATLTAASDLAAEVVGLWDRGHPGFDPAVHLGADESRSAEAVERRMLEALSAKRLEVIALANLAPTALPDSVQAQIAARVREGKGLILTYTEAPPNGPLGALLAEAAPPEEAPAVLEGLPACDAPGGTELANHVTFLNAGDGRVALVRYPGDVPAFHALWPPGEIRVGADPHHDAHATAFYERLIQWASGKNRSPRISGIQDVSPEGPNEMEIPPELTEAFVESMRDSAVAQPLRRVQIDFVEPLERGTTIQVRVRKAGIAGPGYQTEDSLGKGAEWYQAQLLMGAGEYWVDAKLLHKGKVEDWYSEQVTIDSWPEITTLTPDRQYLDRNDTLALSIGMRPVYSTHRQATVYVRAIDTLGRMAGQAMQEFNNEGGEAVVRLHLADLIAPFLRIEVLAVDGPPRMLTSWDRFAGDNRVLYFPVRVEPEAPPLGFGIIDTRPAEPNDLAYWRRLHALGASAVMAGGGRAGQLAAADAGLRAVPLVASYAAATAVNGDIRVPGLHDSIYRGNEEERLLDEVLVHYAGGGQAYSLGNPALIIASEENVCQSEETQSAFRIWQHANAAAWPWDETDATVSFARFRLFMEDSFAEFLGTMRGHLRAVDSAAQVGLRAEPRSVFRGYNWPDLLGRLDYVASDMEALLPWRLSSYQPRAGLTGPVLTSDEWGMDAEQAAWWPRFAAMAGLQTLWLDTPAGNATSSPAVPVLHGAGDPDARFAAFAEALQTANAGFARLLAQAQPVLSPVVLLDSRYTQLALHAEAGGYGALDDAMRDATALLIGWGQFPRYLDEQALVTEARVDAKVVLLPAGIRLTPPVRMSLERFASAGGRVWALGVVLDEHGAPMALAESWTSIEAMPRNEIVDALYDAGVEPAWPLEREYLTEAPDGILYRAYTVGDARIYAAIPAAPEASRGSRVPVRFAEEAVVFDRTGGEEVRRPRKASVQVSPELPGLLAELRYHVLSVEVVTPELVAAGDRLSFTCHVRTDALGNGAHPLRITLHPPHGEPIAGGERVVTAKGGTAQGYFPTAANMIPGAYVVEATDLLTGVSGEARLEVVLSGNPGMQLVP